MPAEADTAAPAGATPAFRRRALLCWLTAALSIAASLGSLFYALYSGSNSHWPAVLWQLLLLLGILSFGLGLWNSSRHYHWRRQQSGQPVSEWD